MKLKHVFLGAILFSVLAVAFVATPWASTTGFVAAVARSNAVTAIPVTLTPIPVSTQKQSDIEAYLAELPAKIAAYQTKYPLAKDIQEDFPLYPLDVSVLGVDAKGVSAADQANYIHCAYKVVGCSPWDSSFYFISLLKMAVPKDASFIAVNYYYKQRMGGGQYAYASHYGWKIDFNFAVIYEINPAGICSTEAVQVALADFNLADGPFVLRKDGHAVRLQDYVRALC